MRLSPISDSPQFHRANKDRCRQVACARSRADGAAWHRAAGENSAGLPSARRASARGHGQRRARCCRALPCPARCRRVAGRSRRRSDFFSWKCRGRREHLPAARITSQKCRFQIRPSGTTEVPRCHRSPDVMPVCRTSPFPDSLAARPHLLPRAHLLPWAHPGLTCAARSGRTRGRCGRYRAGAAVRSSDSGPRSFPSTGRSSRRYGRPRTAP